MSKILAGGPHHTATAEDQGDRSDLSWSK
jgi:hypothetical protein